jgi:hypothetical protein
MQGRSDIFQGLIERISPELIAQLFGTSEEHVAQLQRAGLIRTDLPVHVITFFMGALKVGIINTPDVVSRQPGGASPVVPTMEELTEGLSDLMRRWLEPEQSPENTEAGKAIITEWMEQATEFGQH